MSKKYDVELITDKNGKPMPQYYDAEENEMKPITSDNTGNIEIDNFPAEQDVNIKNDELNIKGNVNVDNLPQNQDVTLTNDTIDVNVKNQTDNVEVNNLPSDYPDSAVKAELESIKQTQADILAKLNDTINTRLIGSIDEYALPVESAGSRVEEVVLLDRKVRTGNSQQVISNVPANAKAFVIVMSVYGVTGNYEEGEGYSLSMYRHTRGSFYAYVMTRMDRKTSAGNDSGAILNISTDFADKDISGDGDFQIVQDTLFPAYRARLTITGTFDEGEGVDCDVKAYYFY